MSPGPAFNVQDIYPATESHFVPEANRALKNKSNSVLYQYNEPIGAPGTYNLFNLLSKLEFKSSEDQINSGKIGWIRKVAMCRFFGAASEYHNLDKSAAKLVDMINDLATRNYIKATLMPLSIMKLAITEPTQKQLYVVISYVHIIDIGEQYVKDNYAHLSINEGEMPRVFGDNE